MRSEEATSGQKWPKSCSNRSGLQGRLSTTKEQASAKRQQGKNNAVKGEKERVKIRNK